MNTTYLIGEIITIGTMAIALSLDGFSLGIGMGMYEIRLRRILSISLIVGAFHVVMPLIGMLIGKVLSVHFGQMAIIIGGLLLLFLGFEMIRSSFTSKRESVIISPYGIGLIVFAVTISLDSFSVGLSLGIFGARVYITILLFGIASMLLTLGGLLLGRKVQGWFGTYSEAIGGCILFAFGLQMILPYLGS